MTANPSKAAAFHTLSGVFFIVAIASAYLAHGVCLLTEKKIVNVMGLTKQRHPSFVQRAKRSPQAL